MMKFQFLLTALATIAAPTLAWGYGAAHAGYTHVGPTGVYHVGGTEARGPYGSAGSYNVEHVGGSGTEYRGGSYGAERGGAYGTEYRGGAYGVERTGTTGTAGYGAAGYHYAPSYGGAASGAEVHYGYVR